jgi:hypothetical protein
MSIDYGIYVGPYVECKVQSIEVTKTRKACTKRGCPNHEREISGSAFCNLCGSPIGAVEYVETEQAVDDWPLTEAINERLTTTHGDAYYTWGRKQGIHLWKANVSTGGRDYHLESREDFALYEIAPDQIGSEVAAFEQQFARELAIFREAYGAGAVRVAWGVIQDYS